MDVIVFLYAGDGGMEALQAFESKVLPIVTEHGGRLERAFAPNQEISNLDDAPDEVHVLSFPSHAAFQAYRDDSRHPALADERQWAIRKTIIVAAGETKTYT